MVKYIHPPATRTHLHDNPPDTVGVITVCGALSNHAVFHHMRDSSVPDGLTEHGWSAGNIAPDIIRELVQAKQRWARAAQ